MSKVQILGCLRTLQVVSAVPTIPEEQIVELVQQGLIQRDKRNGTIKLTHRGVLTKTGEI